MVAVDHRMVIGRGELINRPHPKRIAQSERTLFEGSQMNQFRACLCIKYGCQDLQEIRDAASVHLKKFFPLHPDCFVRKLMLRADRVQGLSCRPFQPEGFTGLQTPKKSRSE